MSSTDKPAILQVSNADLDNLEEQAGLKSIQWSEPKPLNNVMLPVKPITEDMLPRSLSGWLVDITERMDNGHLEYAAVCAVTIASALIGRKVGIHPKQHDSWLVIPNLWGCMVGRPSSKKSPIFSEVEKPVRKLEAKARQQFEEDKKTYAADQKITAVLTKDAEAKAADLAKKAAKTNDPVERSRKMDEARALLLDDSGDPEPPVCKRYIVNDTTVEKLGELLRDNPSGLLLSRDELSGWISKLGRPDHQADRAFYLEAYNGNGSFNFDRIGRGSLYIPSNTVSVIGGIQPRKLKESLMSQRSGEGDDGFIERFQLMVFPDDKVFRFTDRSPNSQVAELAHEAFKRMAEIEFREDSAHRPALRFDLQAQQVFDTWYQALESRLREERSDHVQSHLGKYPSLMASLALIFHVLDHGPAGTISKQTAEMAVHWCDVLETHAKRVYAIADDPLKGARVLVERLSLFKDGSFTAEELRNKGWAGLQEKWERDFALEWAENHSYLHKEVKKNSKGRSSITYHINPAVREA